MKAAINIMYTAYHVKCSVSDALKAYGLTPEQYNVLRILKGKYPDQMCVRDIAGRMIERSSNVPRIIDRLELKKLVIRSTSAEDKRETVITLTQTGIDMLESVNEIMEETNNNVCHLNDDELLLLNDLLDRYREA
ncbi:DNA-binding transcriptional regulator, MarR family [Filimonas lacunae]|uniref:DNA-binding transcriptional regulator, MarR family n=1 Tax=Filimonas lacunae TaxID=477680 RepID=A0A173MPG6_9BACT|nr:MarR family transcriptional regulator [Filimonas lacunae]BAV09376.1 transcriptional regulator, MarR family [Filimonas lacunae]SIS72044.1 DNA-binding transcriptional regulator, MarR family [Filimonas lacunae]